MKVATYARCSTTHHDQDPTAQINELRSYATARGWKIHAEVIDHGYSGSTDKRPGLNRIMALARERKIDAIVVYKLDRFGRSLKHLVTTIDELQALGVLFVAVADHIDLGSPQGRLMLHVLSALSEFEKSILIQRTHLGLAHARSKGKVLGRPKIHNYDKIRELRAQGFSYQKIQQELKVSKGAVHRALKTTSKTPSKFVSNSAVISAADKLRKTYPANGRIRGS